MRKRLRELMLRRNSVRRLYAMTGECRAAYGRLVPWQVRQRKFATTWRGLHPDEVATFLDRVANDLASLYAELAAVHEENQRIKDALRRWQSSQAPRMRDVVRR